MGNNMYDECKRRICDALVESKMGRLVVRPDYAAVLDPYGSMGYPLSRVGFLGRVTRRYTGNWVNIPALADSLVRDGQIADMVGALRLSRVEVDELVLDSLSRIGAVSYNPEWTSIEANRQLEEVIESSTSITVPANNILARTLESKVLDHFGSHTGEGPLAVIDIGVGVGNTIMPLLNMLDDMSVAGKIPLDYRDRLRLFLVDVSQHALGYTLSRVTSKEFNGERGGAVPTKNVIPINVNFADMGCDGVLSSQKGNIHIVISGAAICHQTDLQPFFEQVHGLLRPDGVLHAWDWYNGPSFAAPRLRIGKDERRGTMLYIREKDGGMWSGKIFDGEVLSEDAAATMRRRFEDAERFMAVYEMREDEEGIVLSNFRTLLGILGYVWKGADGRRHARKVWETDIEEHLKAEFTESIRTSRGFSYFDDFLMNVVPHLDNPLPNSESAYYLIEGYGDDYARVMRKAGFSRAEDRFFIEVYRKHRDAVDRSMTQAVPAYQIRYTFGSK